MKNLLAHLLPFAGEQNPVLYNLFHSPFYQFLCISKNRKPNEWEYFQENFDDIIKNNSMLKFEYLRAIGCFKNIFIFSFDGIHFTGKINLVKYAYLRGYGIRPPGIYGFGLNIFQNVCERKRENVCIFLYSFYSRTYNFSEQEKRHLLFLANSNNLIKFAKLIEESRK